MNVKLLQKIKKHILEEPERYGYDWVARGPAPCGTKACIAGWALVLSEKLTAAELRKNQWSSQDAAKVLDITDDQKSRLFIWWPEDSHGNHLFDQNDAKGAAKRIDYFIKTKGTDEKC